MTKFIAAETGEKWAMLPSLRLYAGSENINNVIRNLKREALPASGHVNSVISTTIFFGDKPQQRRTRRMYKEQGPVRYCRECQHIVTLGHECPSAKRHDVR